MRTWSINCLGYSSMQVTGWPASYGRQYTSSACSIRHAESASRSGAMHHRFFSFGLRSFLLCLRRTISREIDATTSNVMNWLANKFKVQPVRSPGACDHASFTNCASACPSSLRHCGQVGLVPLQHFPQTVFDRLLAAVLQTARALAKSLSDSSIFPGRPLLAAIYLQKRVGIPEFPRGRLAVQAMVLSPGFFPLGA
jgi:hypothetical protein